MITHHLELDYALHPGWMAPFVEGLQRGKAIARSCGACKRVSFPPHRTCVCGGLDGKWFPLPGTAAIGFRTDGSDGQFALVKFDGADTSAVVRLQDLAESEANGRLTASDSGQPMLILGPVAAEEAT